MIVSKGGILLNTELICALVTVGGTVISAIIAWIVSHLTANKEIEKMKLSWEREDLVSSDDEFADMAAAVARYVAEDYESHRTKAMEKVASIRSKESGNIAELLDLLYNAITKRQPSQANDCLAKVIEQKRETKCGTDPKRKKKPTK